MREYFKVTEEGVSEKELEELQRQLGYTLPTAYLSFLQETNGAEWCIHDKKGDCLNLWRVQNVPEWSKSYLQDWLPDCVLIGSDGGGRGIVFDRTASSDPDSWTVYRVDFGDLDRDEMVWVADSFLEWANREFRLPHEL